MELTVILLNLYYIGVAVALLIREILWLRTVMVLAGSSVISYGIMTGNNIVVAWNALFVSINIFQVIRLILERRPIEVDPDIEDIYQNVFPEMTAREFLNFWHMGSLKFTRDETLCTEGQVQTNLLLIINGSARVMKEGHEVAELSRGSFVAEMGFIMKTPATADVIAAGELEYISWSRKKIAYMQKASPDMASKLQVILSRDLVHKIEEHQ